MKISLVLTLFAAFIPVAAHAETGGVDSKAHQSVIESYAMMRDGRLERAMEEQRANKEAFEALKQREMQQPSTGYVRLPRR